MIDSEDIVIDDNRSGARIVVNEEESDDKSEFNAATNSGSDLEEEE